MSIPSYIRVNVDLSISALAQTALVCKGALSGGESVRLGFTTTNCLGGVKTRTGLRPGSGANLDLCNCAPLASLSPVLLAESSRTRFPIENTLFRRTGTLKTSEHRMPPRDWLTYGSGSFRVRPHYYGSVDFHTGIRQRVR